MKCPIHKLGRRESLQRVLFPPNIARARRHAGRALFAGFVNGFSAVASKADLSGETFEVGRFENSSTLSSLHSTRAGRYGNGGGAQGSTKNDKKIGNEHR